MSNSDITDIKKSLSDPDLLEAARKLFAGSADFIWAADKIDGLPPINFCFLA